MTFSEKLQTCRKSKGLSQEELAAALEVSRQALSKWECGTSMPEPDKLVALSEYFQVSTDYLLKDSMEAPESTPRVEAEIEKKKHVPNGRAIIAVFSALAAIGLITSFAQMADGSSIFYWDFSHAALGLGIQAAAVGLFEAEFFYYRLEKGDQFRFWAVACWALLPLPILFCFNSFIKLLPFPYPTILLPFLLGAVWIALSFILTALFLRLSRK